MTEVLADLLESITVSSVFLSNFETIFLIALQ